MIFKIVIMGIRVHPRSPEVIKVRRLRQTLIFFGKKKFLQRRFFCKKLLKITHLNRLSKKKIDFYRYFKRKKFLLRSLFENEFFLEIFLKFEKSL